MRSRRVLLSSKHTPEPRTIVVREGKVEAILAWDAVPANAKLLDYGDSVVMPGIVDTHAHINEPGRTEWEGFVTATNAAAAGGISTVIDMPLNSLPPTTTVAALEVKSKAAHGKCRIDYGFWGGVIPGNLEELAPMIDGGVWGFKAFLCDSGVPEFPPASEGDLRNAMAVLAKRRVPLLAHAELEVSHPPTASDHKAYRGYLASRPPEWEVAAIQRLIGLSKETGCQVHIVHLSAAAALRDIEAAKREGVRITAETCPHYLTLDAESVPDGATPFKCAPPIREKANQEALWKGLEAGVIDFVVSDHSPCTPDLKRMASGDFTKAWGGIAGLQFSLPLVWTRLKERGGELPLLVKWMAEGPARLAGLPQKGSLLGGYDADMVVWNPGSRFELTEKIVRHRHTVTPYAGKLLYGVVEATLVRGAIAFANGTPNPAPLGQELRRKKGSL